MESDDGLMLMQYLDKFIDLCSAKDIQLIAFTSPRCPANDEVASTPWISAVYKSELRKRKISINHILPYEHEELYKVNLVKDLGHLNNKGAVVFSQIVARNVRDKLDETTDSQYGHSF